MENSENIRQKAIILFSKKGYEGVGVQEICQASGITKPTLYYYYACKSGVLEQIREIEGQSLYYSIRNAATYTHDFIKGLTQLLKVEIENALENPHFFRLHTNLMHSPKESESYKIYNDMHQAIQEEFENFFILSANEFGNMRGKEKLYALLFRNTIIQAALSVLEGTIKYDDQTVYRIIHSFVYGVAS